MSTFICLKRSASRRLLNTSWTQKRNIAAGSKTRLPAKFNTHIEEPPTSPVHFWHRWSRISLNPSDLNVVTGCDSGVGHGLAIRCWQRGSSVLAGVLDENGPGAKSLRELGCRVHVFPLDLTKDSSIRDFTERINCLVKQDKLKLHALVNNAGVMIFGEFEWQLAEQIREQLTVNLLGSVLLTRELMPLIRGQRARLVNVTSHCAETTLPGLSVYSASKAGLQAWTDGLRIEFRKFGSHAIYFIPGSFFMETNIMARQKQRFDKMFAAMSDECKQFYGEYYEDYTKHLLPLSNEKQHDLVRSKPLFELFDGALLDKKPSHVYKHEPWRYTYYYTLFKIMPVPIRDLLVQKFMAMPKFKR